uniref:Uncharacterized protein n=1 Tax=Arundo donax TaxID=35708 RepID=A0A0A8YPN5_ARUDO
MVLLPLLTHNSVLSYKISCIFADNDA